MEHLEIEPESCETWRPDMFDIIFKIRQFDEMLRLVEVRLDDLLKRVERLEQSRRGEKKIDAKQRKRG